MEIAIERLVALSCFVVGVSHIIQSRIWVELFMHWREKGDVGVFYTALLHLNLGALIVAFHNVWQGLPLLVTVLGWGWTIKGLLYLIFPRVGRRLLERISFARAHEFVVAGVVLVIISMLIAWSLAARGALWPAGRVGSP